MQIIVFGNDHTNTVGVIQSLGIAGYRSIGLLFGNKTGYVKSSKYTDAIITAKDAQTCIDKLLQIKFQEDSKIPIICCCDEAALTVEKNHLKLSLNFVYEEAKNYSLQYLSHKEQQVKLAKETGFNVPNTYNLNDSKKIPEDLQYPCIIKPLISCKGAKSDIRICQSYEDLKKNLESLKFTKAVLLQQYIDRDFEISVLGCGLTNGQCLIPAIENKLTLYPKYVGLECLVYIEPLTNNELKQSIIKLIKKIGYIGPFSIEMMHCKSDNKYYFTEINLRNDGANNFITKYGANIPLNHIEDLCNIPLTPQTHYNSGYYLWDMHHLRSMMCGDISVTRWLKEIWTSKGFLMYNRKDLKPFFRQYSYMLGRLIGLIKVSKYN